MISESGMGQKASVECVLDGEVVEELRMKTTFSEEQILRLFRVYVSLDESGSGGVRVGDLCRWDVFASNPFLPRIVELAGDGHGGGGAVLSFVEFVVMLRVFSPLAPADEKARFLFSLYDGDGDGLISAADLTNVLQTTLGNYLSADEIRAIVSKAIAENACLNPAGLITFEEFVKGVDMQQVIFHSSILF